MPAANLNPGGAGAAEAFPEFSRSMAARYGVALVATCAAILVSRGAWHVFEGIPFLPLFLGMFVAGWYGGGGPCLLVTLLGAFASMLMLFEPVGSFVIHDAMAPPRIALFAAVGCIASWLYATLWKSRRAQLELLGKARRASRDGEAARTDRERLYQDAQEAVRVRDAFLSVAGHELRSPLGALTLYLHSYRREAEVAGDSKALERYDRLQRQGDRLTRLVEELLDVSRITRGRLELEPQPADMRGIVERALERVGDSARRAGCATELDAPSALEGTWDASRVEQVVAQLLDNAFKFGRGKPVKLSLHRSGDWAVFSVEDHGPGISAADQSRVFERFERAVPERSYGGFGLGLSVAREIVDAHGGTISVESASGEGSRFTVRLPLLASAPRPKRVGGESASPGR